MANEGDTRSLERPLKITWSFRQQQQPLPPPPGAHLHHTTSATSLRQLLITLQRPLCVQATPTRDPRKPQGRNNQALPLHLTQAVLMPASKTPQPHDNPPRKEPRSIELPPPHFMPAWLYSSKNCSQVNLVLAPSEFHNFSWLRSISYTPPPPPVDRDIAPSSPCGCQLTARHTPPPLPRLKPTYPLASPRLQAASTAAVSS